jgi:hypothetical protein
MNVVKKIVGVFVYDLYIYGNIQIECAYTR